MKVNVQANPCFKEVDRSRKRYIVMKGSAGSGKSVDTAQNYILRLMRDKGRNLVAMRKSDITNRDSTFAELTGSLYKMFGDKADAYWKINRSPLMLTCRHNRFIDNAYRERMERRKIVDPEGYQIYGLGEWGEIGGLILHNWEVREVSQNLNNYDDVAIGQDFGFNHADAILLVGIKDENIYIIDEIYEHEKETAEIIPIAIQHGIPAKKIMWCDSAEPDRIKEWNKAGYRARGVDKGGSKGSVNAQIDWLKGSVGKDHTIKRKIYVAPHCVNTIKELQQWKWKKDERTGEYLDDPVPVMDDAMAALRYAIEGWRKASRWLM